ncbi:MAG: (5-formylfuran-3-yl)methyl phosphate synthase [Burkholderiales bacterium]
MSKLLASVMSVEEAQIALDYGADIIDCKDPSSGALGALPNETISEIVKVVASRRPVSATIGDLPMQPYLIFEAVKSKLETGVDFVKVGFFPDGNSPYHETLSLRANAKQSPTESNACRCITRLNPLASRTSLIAVLFADQNPDLNLLPLVADTGFAGIMLDTADKGQGGLRRCVSHELLARFISRAKSLGLMTGLAGSLKVEDVPSLLELGPDYLGFRGALCETARANAIRHHNVTEIANAMSLARSSRSGLKSASPTSVLV